MIASGMVRKIDLLGRIVIPKEIRRSLKIDSGDDIEMYIENDNIILKKYQALNNYSELAKSYCLTIYDSLHINCFVCSKENIIASSQNTTETISNSLIKVIVKGQNAVLNDSETIPLFASEEISKYKSQCISPVKCMGDVYGAIVAYSTKKDFTEKELDLIFSASLFFCGQLK